MTNTNESKGAAVSRCQACGQPHFNCNDQYQCRENQLMALDAKAAAGNNFAGDLAAAMRRNKVSPKQDYWIKKLAFEYNSPAPAPKALGGNLAVIAAKFETAKAHGLKHPALLFFNIAGAVKTRVTLAPANGKNPGCLYVKADGNYAGKITPAGDLHAMRNAPPALIEFLHAFALDPVGIGAANGKDAGLCCYCGHELTDERSLEAGYGPICAKHWELPWGAAKSAPKKALA